MNKLTKLQIEILSEYYARSFDAWEAWGDIYDALKKHGNDKKYTIYRVMCKHMGSYLMNYSKIFISKFWTEKKITKLLNSKYNNEICIKFIVYRY